MPEAFEFFAGGGMDRPGMNLGPDLHLHMALAQGVLPGVRAVLTTAKAVDELFN